MPSTAHPYARVGEEVVAYAGPSLDKPSSGPIHIILFGQGAAAAANSDEMRAALASASSPTTPWELIPIEGSQNWGAASTQLVSALMDQHAVAIIATDRNSAHLSEQLALKKFVPVIALASDKTLTSTNIPWIFRLSSKTNPARAVSLLDAAVRIAGHDFSQLRAVLASGQKLAGMAFTATGEPLNP